ncbi:DEAD/DEAH box helicase (plasmid) [Desulfosarcina ovata subsp. sediminis]|uniref:DEAD/DEAH box helicase n=1 Tax=Desulfosarcina ovata subsp. sediminis TaxID=885957 RepID=A0A5K8A2Y4_9BACT|nr:DEAD/DEAH box helicase [Desulfosarcina ovata]BBO86801.1 DEAD/DEAH box helicase [Desulfosarcina ovata subsp. sediminis]
MVDFQKLTKKSTKRDYKNLLALFDALDRQTSHTDPRPAQKEALLLLSQRRTERDHILKISTGAGKTSIGLLYLLSFMEEYKQPVVYLCPTKQLIAQVQAESIKLGISSTIYPAGEPFPTVDGISAKAIIICTYDKLFNGKTTFDRSDVMLRPCAIVMDDVHAGLEEIRDSFTLSLQRCEIYNEFITIFNEPCKKFNPGVWNDICGGDPNQSMEIPFWIWRTVLPQIEELLSSKADDDRLLFVYPYIRDLLKWCRCIITGMGLELIPDILPIHKCEAFANARHRLFMSATLADDSVLVRDIEAELKSANHPLIPESDKGLGERMILAPSLVDKTLDRSWVMSLCRNISSRFKVVVLSPSEKKAREWEVVGAKVFLRDQVLTAVEELKNPASALNYAIFVQRYDGIDLPDNACRVLVMDGMPYGEGIIDKHDSSLSSVAGGIRKGLIYRIEQGIGRAVRSYADFAVILLVGPELAHFIAKHEILSEMNADTQNQLRLSIDLANIAMEETDPANAIVDMIKKCLRRDEGWKQFYNETVREAKKVEQGVTDKNRLMMADAERRAFNSVMANDPSAAVSILRNAINDYSIDDLFNKGLYLQRIAKYQYEIDPGSALEIQRSAYENNRSICCPPAIAKRPKPLISYNVQSTIINWFNEFANPNGAIAFIQDLKTKLSFNLSAKVIEQSICDLAPLIGAKGLRPEKEFGEGPDDMWLWPEISLIIEAKNQNESSLHKSDAGQLLLSLQWFENNYPARSAPIPIVVAKVTKCDRKTDFPANTRVITQEKIYIFLDTLEKFYYRIASEPLFASNPKTLIDVQKSLKLTPESFIKTFTERIT